MTTHNFANTKEQGLETLIYKAMTDRLFAG
jgi:hypothetical protein